MKKFTLTIAGASGVVGRHIIKYALSQNWKIRILSRNQQESNNEIEYYLWNPDNKNGDYKNIVNALEGSDFIINLAGKSLSQGRLNTKMQADVLNSRLNATNNLIEAYRRCKAPPKVWGQASAIGFYGDSKEEIITEASSPGNLFLSNVCVQWEQAVLDIKRINPDIKLFIARFGLVLADDAAAWKKMVTPVRMGMGGAIGSGNQWFSWIDAEDLAEAFFYLFHNPDSSGIYNFSSPQAVRQKDLAAKIAEFYRKPHFMKIPAFFMRILMGKAADELLLASCRALPEKLLKAGYRFKYSDIEEEINHLLK